VGATICDLHYWLSYRKYITDRFLPEPRWLKELYHRPPYWYVIPFTLSGQQTAEFRQTAKSDTWIVSLAGTVVEQSAGFQVRILDARRKRYWETLFLDQANALGTGSQRYHIRTPQRFRKGDTIVVEVTNVDTSLLTSQVVLEGIEDVRPNRSA
jgi:hypothetical protein